MIEDTPKVRYTAAGDRSTFERDYAEVRMVKRLAALVIVLLIIGYMVMNHAH